MKYLIKQNFFLARQERTMPLKHHLIPISFEEDSDVPSIWGELNLEVPALIIEEVYL